MYTSSNSFTSIDSLRQWFELQDSDLWTLFSGAGTRPSDLIHRMDVSVGMEKSWEVLEAMLMQQSELGGGSFTVLSKKTAGTTNGPRVRVTLPPASARAGSPGVAGISQQMIDAQINDAIDKFRLQHENDMLRQELAEAESGGYIGKIMERVAQHPNLHQVIDVFIARILGNNVAVTGFGSAQQPTEMIEEQKPTKKMAEMKNENAPASTGPTHEGNQEGTKFNYDLDRLAASLEVIRAHFPDIHEFMETLANFVESNPSLAKTFFNNQKKMGK